MKSKLLSFSIALLASICLWMYVVSVVNPEGSKSIYGIPVTFAGEEELREDQSLIITEGSDTTVTLKLNGKRSALNKLESENISVVVDVSRIRKAGDFNMSFNIVYPSGVSESDLSEQDRIPGTVSFSVEPLVTKIIEVKGIFDGNVAEGYMADPMTFDYGEIAIEGPEAQVQSVSYAQVILSRTNLDKTVTTSLPYSLIDEEGNLVVSDEITSDVEEIEVTLPILKYKDIPLTVKFLNGGGATSDDVTCDIDPLVITVAGDPALLDSVNQISLGNIDLGDIVSELQTTLPITIPDGLKNVSGDEEADVSVKIRGLESKTVRASNIRITGEPDGYTAISITQMLQVTVRAPSSEIGRISADNLRVVADLTEAELTKEGSYTVPVTIYIDGFEKAGVIGDYTIVVSLESE